MGGTPTQMRPTSRRPLAAALLVLCATRAAALAAPSGYMVRQLTSVKGAWLLHTWNRAVADTRAQGFQPATEAIGDGATRMKALSEELPKLVAQANILGLCEKGTMRFDSLQEPHASMAERLSRTSLKAAISAGKGSALAFVSEWPGHVSIDACVVNPAYLALGQEAEALLLGHVTQEALEGGAAAVRLTPSYQVDGDAFYARCGFYPVEGAEEPMLEFRAAT